MVLFTLLTVILLTLFPLPAKAQDQHEWIDTDPSSYASYTDLPIEVKVGLQIDQITGVDQRAENFGVVGMIRLEWHDPKLAFDPPENGLPFKRYKPDVFLSQTERENIFFPEFTIYNQQGRRSSDQGVLVSSDGNALYAERFTATLQAPDFEFEKYPFDVQRFFISIDTEWPETMARFVVDTKFSGLGTHLGLEEWDFREEGAEVTSHTNILGQPANRITFVFTAFRHTWYYVLRIFIPLLIIVVVSWVTFFLKDFSKRVDISGGNLLVYVAFNFAISRELPRLGYMTFMDSILASTFIITSFAVIFNVILRRLEVAGREHVARKIDTYTLWVYPSAYLLVVYLALHYFFPRLRLEHWLGFM